MADKIQGTMADQQKELMTVGSYRSKIILFAIPIFLGNLFQQLYNAVDSMIVGNFVGSTALAAVSTAGHLTFLVIGFFNGISVGAGVVIATFIGAGNKKSTEEAVHTTVALGLAFSVLLTILGIWMAPFVLRAMNTPADVMPESITYFQIYFAGATGFVMYNTFVGILQAAGDSKHPLYYLVISSVINVVLDLVLIAGFGMGVGAAAFATAVSQVVSALLSLIRLMRKDTDYRVRLRSIRFVPGMTSRILKFGLPTGIQNSVMAFSNVIIQSYINVFGAAAMAGIGAFTKVEAFAFIPITAFMMAISTFVGQNLGAGLQERVKKGIRFSLICTLVSGEALGLILYLFAEPLIALFDSTPEVVAFGAGRAHTVALFFFLCAFTHYMAAVLRGAGHPMEPMVVFMVCWCLMRILILWIFSPIVQSIEITYWVYPITWTLSTIALLVIYLRTDLNKTMVK